MRKRLTSKTRLGRRCRWTLSAGSPKPSSTRSANGRTDRSTRSIPWCFFRHTTGHVWTAPLRQVLIWRGDDCGPVQSCVWPVGAAILTTAGPDVVREAGPDQILGLDTRDPKKGSPASTIDRSPSCHQHLRNRDAAYGVFLSLWRWNRAPRVAAITPLPSPYPVAAHASARYWGAQWPAS